MFLGQSVVEIGWHVNSGLENECLIEGRLERN